MLSFYTVLRWYRTIGSGPAWRINSLYPRGSLNKSLCPRGSRLTHQTVWNNSLYPRGPWTTPYTPGVQADSPVPGVGRTSSVTGHKTSAVSRPCISKTTAWRSSQNSEQNQSKHSKRLGQCEQAARSDYTSNAVSSGQSNVFTKSLLPTISIPVYYRDNTRSY